MSSEANYRSLNIIHRVLSIVIALSLFTSSAPAAPRTVVDVTRESAISFYFWFHNSVFARLVQGQGIGLIKKQEKQADRDARISRLQIFPGDVKINMGERVRFVALAFDQDDNPIGGIRRSVKPRQSVRFSLQMARRWPSISLTLWSFGI